MPGADESGLSTGTSRPVRTSRLWSVAIGFALVALFIVSVLLVLAAVRVELPGVGLIDQATTTLTLLVAVLAVGATGGALGLLQRQNRVEQDLRRSEETFHGISTIAADAIITIDAAHHIVHFNHGAEVMFGYPAAAITGQPLSLLLPERFRAAHPGHIRTFAEGSVTARRMGERRAVFALRQDGKEFQADASISKLTVDGVTLFNVVLRDVTDARRREDNQRFLAATSGILNASLDFDSILRSVANVGVPYLSDCAVLHVRAPSGEIRCVASVHEDPVISRTLQAIEATNEVWPEIMGALSATDTKAVERLRRPIESREGLSGAAAVVFDKIGAHTSITVPLRSRQSTLAALTLFLTDASRDCPEDSCELAAQVAERAAHAIDNGGLFDQARKAVLARDEVLGVVSHDLRNPLSAIGMSARVLAAHPPDDAEARRSLANNILSAVDLMHGLIRDLLDVVMIESGHFSVSPATVPASQLIEQSAAMTNAAAVERGLKIQVLDGSDGASVRADVMRIAQVLGNLLANSVKFTQPDGQVVVRAERLNGGVRFEVEDSGCGIPATFLPHIFDRYWHAKRHSRTVGTGLGLAIAKGIVEAHGSRLEVWSEEGKGTRFAFVLPSDGEEERSVKPEEQDA